MKIHFSLIVFFLLVSSFLKAQDVDTTALENSQREFLRLPSFSIYKDNYFISGTSINHTPNKYNSDIKYQISIRQLLYRKPLLWGSFPYLSYTQKSFWNIYQNSKPFSEINFNPTLGLIRPYKNKYGMNFFTLALEHESNGRDSIFSRSWNRISASWHAYLSKKLQVSVDAWIPFDYKDENPDILRYYGYGQVSFSYIIKDNKWYADVLLRKGNQWNWNGYVQSQISYKLFPKSNEYLMLQWYTGEGESLINYQKYVNKVRIGLLLRPNKNVYF